MRLLLDDTFATKPWTVAASSGWAAAPDGMAVTLVEHLAGDDVARDDAALISSFEFRRLLPTHAVMPNIAVIADGVGAVAMRTPVRPDEIESTPIRLLGAGGTAELLARATLQPFYGITPTAWIRGDDEPEAARAEVVIVEGAEALREPEGGFSEDLARAWFILTSQPVVSHVLAVPHDLPTAETDEIVRFLADARALGLERRREWRGRLAEREGVGRDRASAFWAAQRFTMQAADRAALLDLLARGSRGAMVGSPLTVQFREGTSAQ